MFELLPDLLCNYIEDYLFANKMPNTEIRIGYKGDSCEFYDKDTNSTFKLGYITVPLSLNIKKSQFDILLDGILHESFTGECNSAIYFHGCKMYTETNTINLMIGWKEF